MDITPSSLGYGIPGQDNATGNGFILYSQQNVQERFAGAVVANGAEHFGPLVLSIINGNTPTTMSGSISRRRQRID
ncbi:hypothetical protein [Rubinisphaera sp.]|uniref:hypothetical protein n=1 Tax=Rubinisphaera sp. TaxID=2024857 RepID=UPI0025E815AD|nr:hypothetical protein [Rubinisphaera sp.]